MANERVNAEVREDTVGKLSQISCRTSLMVIDTILLAASAKHDLASAALEAGISARRMQRATEDFAAALADG